LKTQGKMIIGIDEVGRGPIAGPVAVCAFLLKDKKILRYFKLPLDSKQLSAEKREEIFEIINKFRLENRCEHSVSFVSPAVLDKIGITKSIKLAIARSLARMEVKSNECQIYLDGLLEAPFKFTNQKTVIGGDRTIKVIGLASIVAKVARDRRMEIAGCKFSSYSFEKNKGYGTREHFKLLEKFGVCDLHRRSFLKSNTNKISTKYEILVRQAHHPEEFEGEIRKNCKFKKEEEKKDTPSSDKHQAPNNKFEKEELRIRKALLPLNPLRSKRASAEQGRGGGEISNI